MARKESTNYTAPQITEIERYHGGDYKELCVYNSDRKIKLNYDYTVSAENSASTLKIVKAGSHMKVFGLEVETVGDNVYRAGETVYTNLCEMIFDRAGFDPDFFKIEQDGTVHAECITQTFTKAWMRNNYKCWKAMYECFRRFGIETGDQRCGMHVNLDLANFGGDHNAQIENVRKLGYVINKHYDFFRIAFNRTGSTYWCPRMETSKDYWKNTGLSYIPTDHNKCCINVGHIHQHRIEIRLVGGQKNYACFRNTMETVFHLVDRICKLSWNDLDDLTKIFSGCNVHVFSRIAENCLQAGVITADVVNAIRPTVKEERFLM